MQQPETPMLMSSFYAYKYLRKTSYLKYIHNILSIGFPQTHPYIQDKDILKQFTCSRLFL